MGWLGVTESVMGWDGGDESDEHGLIMQNLSRLVTARTSPRLGE